MFFKLNVLPIMFFFKKSDINYNMTIKNKNRQIRKNFGFIFDLMKESKIKTIILSAIVLIAFLTGIIVAIKTKASYGSLSNLGVVCFEKGGVISSSFFTRLLSMLLIALICFGCSFTDYLFPLAILFLSYRGYLLGINICLIIAVNGIGGIVTAILVVFPCQLIALAVLSLFYLLMSKTCRDFRAFGGCRVPNQKLKIIVITLIVLIAICLLEALLLAIFSPKVILVI